MSSLFNQVPETFYKKLIERGDKEPKKEEKEVNIQVVIRCRPMLTHEGRTHSVVSFEKQTRRPEVRVSLTQGGKPITRHFNFDQVYDQNDNNENIFDNVVDPILDQVLDGFNCTVFCYGQTGTGKTYTMEGNLKSLDVSNDLNSNVGIIPRAIYTTFSRLEKSRREFTVHISHLELYNEELMDLLGDEDSSNKLRLFDDTQGGKKGHGVSIQGLEEIPVDTPEKAINLLHNSTQRRHVAETKLNRNSSRSHCIFTLTVHTKETRVDGEDVMRVGRLNLVDLAGSECIARSGSQGNRAKEAGLINQSLLTLGRCINQLVDKKQHIPYRDSKLTRLLQESLGGRARTVIIATITPASTSLDETISTLDYAYRAKSIRCRPAQFARTTQRQLIKELASNISTLKRENECLRNKSGAYMPVDMYESIKKELFDLRNRGDISKKELDDLQKKIEQQEAEISKLKETIKEKNKEIESLIMSNDENRKENSDLSNRLKRSRNEIENIRFESDQETKKLKKEASIVKTRLNHHLTTALTLLKEQNT